MSHGGIVRQHHDADVRSPRKITEGMLDLGAVANGEVDQFDSQGPADNVDRRRIELAEICWIGRVEHESGSRGAGRDLLEYLDPLAAHREFEIGKAGKIAPRS